MEREGLSAEYTRVALSGDYRPLAPPLSRAPVGMLFPKPCDGGRIGVCLESQKARTSRAWTRGTSTAGLPRMNGHQTVITFDAVMARWTISRMLLTWPSASLSVRE